MCAPHRFAAVIAILVLLAVVAIVWIERRPLATRFVKSELDKRGVQATYDLDRIGFRSQKVSHLVIGDPKHPDLTARHAIIQMRLMWNGSFEVYRVYARGVRLRGRLVHGKVSWGQIDKLLPPPSNKPFRLPNFSLDVRDSTISLATPFGPVGVALEGNGMLSGGFKGHALRQIFEPMSPSPSSRGGRISTARSRSTASSAPRAASR